jgi:hypothetical protein
VLSAAPDPGGSCPPDGGRTPPRCRSMLKIDGWPAMIIASSNSWRKMAATRAISSVAARPGRRTGHRSAPWQYQAQDLSARPFHGGYLHAPAREPVLRSILSRCRKRRLLLASGRRFGRRLAPAKVRTHGVAIVRPPRPFCAEGKATPDV